METNKTIMEVIKENKGKIIKGILIALGTIGGLVIAGKVLTSGQEEIMIPLPEEKDDDENVIDVNPEDVTEEK